MDLFGTRRFRKMKPRGQYKSDTTAYISRICVAISQKIEPAAHRQ